MGIVLSRFNDFVTSRLLAGALDALQEHGCTSDRITIAQVPGAFEIPLVAQKMAASQAFDAVICLGCVIRGETPHFEYVAGECARGIARVAMDTGVPTTFGVLTTDTVEQAEQRAGVKRNNKGYETALCAIELVNLLRILPPPR